MKKIIILLLIFISTPLFAQNNNKSNKNSKNNNISEKKESEFYEAPISGIKTVYSRAKTILDYNFENNATNGFSAHKPNYFIYTYSNKDHITRRDVYVEGDKYIEEREKKELKFQVSVKQRFLRFYGWALYFAYTQKSFWQAFDKNGSRPFRETNFNPEFFVRTKMWDGWRFDFGIEHESNGRAEPYSRSWDRIYFTPYFENSWMILSLKTWYRIPEEKKETLMDPTGDENEDIHEFYGYGELRITVKDFIFKDIELGTMCRYNLKHKKGAIQVDLSGPVYANSMYWYIHFWSGYGESLVDYNINQNKIGVGFLFTR